MTCACHPDDAPTPHRGFDRRRLLVTGLAAGLTPLLPRWGGVAGAQEAPEAPAPAPAPKDADALGAEGWDDGPVTRDFGFLPPRPATEVHRRPIMFPVLPDATLGRATWSDTYLAPRSSGRLHEGQDLMGRKMLKLLACTNGVIVELRHQAAGNSLYLRGDDGYYYCYLHINNDRPGTDDASNSFSNAFAPGMAIGRRVAMGDHIGYLGDSGNAEGTGAHCHFEIRLPNARWYNAAACNARYALESAEPARLRTAVAAAAFSPIRDAGAFAMVQAVDFWRTAPTGAWVDAAAAELSAGRINPDAFIEQRLADHHVQRYTNPVIRLYQAYFGGIPAYAGVDLWAKRIAAGRTLDSASEEMAASSKFRSMFDVSTDRKFVAVFFRNLYGYTPSAASIDLRIRKLDSGLSRARVVRLDCESEGYRVPNASRVRVISVYHAMVKESPVQKYLDSWSALDRTSATGMQQLIRAHRTGAKYAARFA